MHSLLPSVTPWLPPPSSTRSGIAKSPAACGSPNSPCAFCSVARAPATALRAWRRRAQTPSPANRQRIDAAYRTYRRHNVANHLLQRLNARGGTRVEIHPLDQTGVQNRRRRVLNFRRFTIRNWNRIVDAWDAGDDQALADAWDDTLPDLGSEWGKYEYVTAVAFSA